MKSGENRNCLWCSKTFWVAASNIRRGQGRYCSHGCCNRACPRASTRKGTGKRAERVCAHCNRTFTLPQHEANRGNGRFCSRECSVRHPKATLAERFWKKVDKNGPIPSHCPELGQCWVWTGAKDDNGYGHIRTAGRGSGGTVLRAHRVMWDLAGEQVPAGLFVCHKCDNPACVRKEHHFLGTAKENGLDCAVKGRAAAMRYPHAYNGRRPARGERIRPCVS